MLLFVVKLSTLLIVLNLVIASDRSDSVVDSFSVSGDVDRFFKLAYSMVEISDVKTLAIKLSPEYKKLCTKIGSRAVAEREVDSALKEKINALQIQWYKMEKLQHVLSRIITHRRRRSEAAAAVQSRMMGQ
jgi:hypothetical protein